MIVVTFVETRGPYTRLWQGDSGAGEDEVGDGSGAREASVLAVALWGLRVRDLKGEGLFDVALVSRCGCARSDHLGGDGRSGCIVFQTTAFSFSFLCK